tara:strand:+ start:317 stop:691 length:375 start_codon:yes stop_codon:yes gene_type:complete
MEDDKIKNHNGEYIGTSKDEILDGLANFNLDEEQYDYFPSVMWKDSDIIFTSCRAGNNASNMFDYIHESLWRDAEFVFDFIYTAERHSQNDDIEGLRIEHYIHESLKSNKEIIRVLESYIDNLS